MPIELNTYVPRFFRLEGSVAVHPDYLPEKVLGAVEAQLRSDFSFETRVFGQGVALSEVVAIIQNVEGVVAVDLDFLHRSDNVKSLNNILPSDIPRPGTEQPFPAELLTLDAQPVKLQLMS